MQQDSDFVGKEPCPACGSSDNLARYSDGHAYCFGCEHYEPGEQHQHAIHLAAKQRRQVSGKLLPRGEAKAIKSRGLTLKTCKRWSYEIGKIKNDPVQVANYFDDSRTLVGQKARTADKEFKVFGDISDLLYGKWLWKEGGRRIIVCEGEIDAPTVDQVLGYKWPVVSPPNGVQSARKAVAKHLEYLNSFDQVVLCFDMDDAGRKATEECVRLFPAGKVRIVSLPHNDPNEMLQADRVEELVRCLWDAKEYRPDGIVTVADVRAAVLEPPRQGLPWCLPGLNEATWGRHYGELVGLGAGTGVGKTTMFAQQIAADLAGGHPVGAFLFEQHPSETVKLVAGMQAQKAFSVPNGDWKPKELVRAVDKLEKSAPFYLYDHFGACEWDVVRERIRYLRHAHDVRLFYLDHLTALAAGQDDERVLLERITAEMGGLVKELDMWMLFNSHLATPDGKPHEEGGRVMIRHFKGSRAIGFWAHFLIGLERNQQADDPTEAGTTVLRVLKARPPRACRATGKTFPLNYNHETGLLAESPHFDAMTSPEEGAEF